MFILFGQDSSISSVSKTGVKSDAGGSLFGNAVAGGCEMGGLVFFVVDGNSSSCC